MYRVKFKDIIVILKFRKLKFRPTEVSRPKGKLLTYGQSVTAADDFTAVFSYAVDWCVDSFGDVI